MSRDGAMGLAVGRTVGGDLRESGSVIGDRRKAQALGWERHNSLGSHLRSCLGRMPRGQPLTTRYMCYATAMLPLSGSKMGMEDHCSGASTLCCAGAQGWRLPGVASFD